MQGLVDIIILAVLNVSAVRQRRRENNTSIALSEISDTSSMNAIVYSEDPKNAKATFCFRRVAFGWTHLRFY
jgi:hypothetical protein